MNKPTCPKCNQNINVVPIVYGMPLGNDLMQKAHNEQVMLGGCSVEVDEKFLDQLLDNRDRLIEIKNPIWFCKKDQYKF